MDAKPGNDKKDDDGGRTEDHRVPPAREETAERGRFVNAGEEREHLVVPDSHPKREDESQGIENRIAPSLLHVCRFCHLAHANVSVATKRANGKALDEPP